MKKLAPLKSIHSFVAVAETGSMTDAALQLNVSHSAVSQAIKSLEHQVGQPVLNPYQDFYFACQKDKLKNEHVLTLRSWLRSEFTGP